MLEKMDVPASSDALPMSIKVLAIVAFVGTLAFVMFVILTIEGPEIERDHSYREPAYTGSLPREPFSVEPVAPESAGSETTGVAEAAAAKLGDE